DLASFLTPELLRQIEEQLNHQFNHRDFLLEALVHSSFGNEKGAEKDNERLEFLGDAVIGLVIGEELWRRFSSSSEGLLSRWRSQLVSRKSLADLAVQVGMGDWVLLGRGEKRTGGSEKQSILAGVFEAVVGALYLDGGLEKTRSFLLRVFTQSIQNIFVDDVSYRKELDQKTFLQEITQSKHRSIPLYRVVDVWGLEHEKNFKVEIEIEGVVVAAGEGRSKKEAEQRAAKKALESYGV
ncbi:MAG: ribonuclease III, partial [Proteobacteria bacterium]|nr:ribonuclease III [Pseudomonadota bacterium]